MTPFLDRSARSRGQVVRRVCEKLESEYGLPRHGNPTEPLDDLVYVLLSNRTPPKRAGRIYEELRSRFPAWRHVLEADREELVEVLRPAGFGEKRTDQVQNLLGQVVQDFGDLEAEDLWSRSDEELLSYLTELSGVSGKVARCVMMYTLAREVLPVDVHTHRVAYRLGWTRLERPEQSHDELEAVVPPHRRYAFHVCCVAHGRARCKASNPRCEDCPIQRYCTFYEENTEDS